MTPLITQKEHLLLQGGRAAGAQAVEISIDLDKSKTEVLLQPDGWVCAGQLYPYLEVCKDHTVYQWEDGGFAPVSRFSKSLIKLVPTHWGPPTFEIDGIKMLPTAKVCPFADAGRKVGLIEPKGKRILDTCGGLGYFAAWCLAGDALEVRSFEKNPDVMWLRQINPWSPPAGGKLHLSLGDISTEIHALKAASVDAVLHDPPRFALAGELYSQAFYDQLARVLTRRGWLFHYTGTPNKLTSGRDVPQEVSKRLVKSGFKVETIGDGLLAQKKA